MTEYITEQQSTEAMMEATYTVGPAELATQGGFQFPDMSSLMEELFTNTHHEQTNGHYSEASEAAFADATHSVRELMEEAFAGMVNSRLADGSADEEELAADLAGEFNLSEQVISRLLDAATFRGAIERIEEPSPIHRRAMDVLDTRAARGDSLPTPMVLALQGRRELCDDEAHELVGAYPELAGPEIGARVYPRPDYTGLSAEEEGNPLSPECAEARQTEEMAADAAQRALSLTRELLDLFPSSAAPIATVRWEDVPARLLSRPVREALAKCGGFYGGGPAAGLCWDLRVAPASRILEALAEAVQTATPVRHTGGDFPIHSGPVHSAVGGPVMPADRGELTETVLQLSRIGRGANLGHPLGRASYLSCAVGLAKLSPFYLHKVVDHTAGEEKEEGESACRKRQEAILADLKGEGSLTPGELAHRRFPLFIEWAQSGLVSEGAKKERRRELMEAIAALRSRGLVEVEEGGGKVRLTQEDNPQTAAAGGRSRPQHRSSRERRDILCELHGQRIADAIRAHDPGISEGQLAHYRVIEGRVQVRVYTPAPPKTGSGASNGPKPAMEMTAEAMERIDLCGFSNLEKAMDAEAEREWERRLGLSSDPLPVEEEPYDGAFLPFDPLDFENSEAEEKAAA